jgi:hypothetical protein
MQGIYYLLTGIWPVIDIASFMLVTGPKTDIWLVKMVGLLTVAIAITLITTYKKGGDILRILAVCAACSYLFIDVYYYFNGTISIVYVGDAVAEGLIIIGVVLTRK